MNLLQTIRCTARKFYKFQSLRLLQCTAKRQFIRHRTVHEGQIIDDDGQNDSNDQHMEETESIEDVLEECDEFDTIQYKTYSLQKQYEFESKMCTNTIRSEPLINNNSVSFNVYPKPYDYGKQYRQSFPINEIIEYLQKLNATQIKVYDVHKCTNDASQEGYDDGYGIIEDKDWFVISVVPSHRDLSNVVKKLMRQGHDRKVFRDSYYNEVHSSYFSSEGESDWCLVDLADSLVLVCHQELLVDPLSIVNQIKDKFWRFLFSTYHPFPNKTPKYSEKL